MTPEPRVTLEQWQALVAVVDAGGYAQAAERLNKSQSAVSYAVEARNPARRAGVSHRRTQGRADPNWPPPLPPRASCSTKLTASSVARTVSAVGRRRSASPPKCFSRRGCCWPVSSARPRKPVYAHRAVRDSARRDRGSARERRGRSGDRGERACRLCRHAAGAPVGAGGASGTSAAPLGRPLTARDLRAHRQLVIRESARRPTPPMIEACATLDAEPRSDVTLRGRLGYGYGWFAEESIRSEIAAGTPAVCRCAKAASASLNSTSWFPIPRT